jgi:hypothetical protein
MLAAAAAWLAGCATSPAPTLHTLTAAELFAARPAALRAAVLTDARVLVQAVVLDLRPPDERFVVLLEQPAPVDDWLVRLNPPAAGREWRVFSPSAEAAATLATLKQMLAGRVAAERIAVTVHARPAMVPADLVAALPLRIDLLLDDRGWLTVADGAIDLRH